MAGDRSRIGVIGTGWWATFAHLPGLAAYPAAELIGVADLDRAKAEQAAARFGAGRAFDDHRALLDLKPDGVVIATPHDTHYALVRDALLAGCDVMVEKPMVVDPAHGRELVALAHERGRNLHIGYPYPYTRHNRLLRDLIEAGELGDILLCSSLFATSPHELYKGITAFAGEPGAGAMWAPGTDTYSDPARGGGQMLTQVTHSASLLFFLTGLRPAAVHAFTDPYDTRVDVWDAINFQTATGAAGSLASTGTVPRAQRVIEEYRIFGSAGHALVDTTRGTLAIYAADGTVREEPPLSEADRYLLFQPARQLVDTILGTSPVLVSGELGLLTVEFLAAALEAARTGRVVHLPIAATV
ncbi:MAG: Gfo/Idh/MocA family oxidoreductase [Chloroflexota bacterium]|nr:Gfo/Idh/MocA family oxidoreductase [Chloroflexota bacterium]